MQTRFILIIAGRVLEPFQLPFVQRGLIEVLILAIPAGLLGTWIVLRGLAFFSHAVGTAAFPGLVLADGLGFAAPLGASAPPSSSAPATRARPRRARAATASSRSCSSAAWPPGVILASDVFRSGANVETLLFGSLLLVDGGDIALAAVAALRPLVASAAARPALARAGFDPDGAGAPGGRSARLDAALLGLIALAATAALSAVGALLVAALFVVPAATARLFDPPDAELAARQRRPGRRSRARPGSGSRSRPTPRRGRRSPARRRRFALVALARGAGARPRRAALAAAAARSPSPCSPPAAAAARRRRRRPGSRWSRRPPRSATGCARSAATPSPSTRSCSRTPTPTSTSRGPATSRRRPAPTLVFASGDGLDAWIDEVVSESGSDAEVVDLGAAVPERLPGESSGAEASEYDPHWWHDPRNAEAAVRRDRAPPRRRRPGPPGAEFERNAARLPRQAARARRAASPAASTRSRARERKLVTDHDAFGYFADRYGIDVVGAVIPSQTTQAQPSAKDARAAGRTDRARGRQARSSRRAR